MPSFDVEAVILAAMRVRDPVLRARIARTLIARNFRPPNRKRPPGPTKDGVPTDPRRPSTLSGGAAAALEFGD